MIDKNKLNTPMRAALYIRVSSEDQAKEGYSLIAQQRSWKNTRKKTAIF